MLTVTEIGLITLLGIATSLGCVYFGFWMGRHTQDKPVIGKTENPNPGMQPTTIEDDPWHGPMYGQAEDSRIQTIPE